MSLGPENSLAYPHRADVKLSPCVVEIQMAFLDASDCVQSVKTVFPITPEHMWLYLTE